MREKQFWTDSGKKETILLDIDMHKLYELHVCKCISSTNIVQNCMPQAVSQVVSINDRRTEEWQKNYRNLSSNRKTVLCRMYSFRWPFSHNSTRSNIVFLRIGRFACFFISFSIISLCLEPLHVCSPTPKIPLSSFSGPKLLYTLVLSPNSPLFQWDCFSLLTSILSFTLLGCLESRSRDALERYLLLSSPLCRSAFCPLNSLLYFSKKKHSSLLLLWN